MNKMPKGDVWHLKDTDATSQWYEKDFSFNFECFTSNEIKSLIKNFIFANYKTGNNTVYKLVQDRHNFTHFQDFLTTYKIDSLKGLTNIDIQNYQSFLNTRLSSTTNKPLSHNTKRHCMSSLKTLIYWGQVYMPEYVPDNEIFTGNEYIGSGKTLKIEFIPDEVVSQINNALTTETNMLIRYGIIILESTGMRVGDLLNLTTDCIGKHLINGYTISWLDHKNRKNREPMPVRTECVDAVHKLLEYTSTLRKECGSDKLIIYRATAGKTKGQIISPSHSTFQKWMRNFVSEHNICDTDGSLYNLTSHQFRRTLGTDMLSKGTDISVIQQVLGHSTPEITKRFYADVKDKERMEIFKNIGVIGNINQIQSSAFDNVSEFEWFKANKDKGACMCDGYCTKPVVDGKVCDRLLKRQKCYTCSRYITTPEYLETHKQHLANLERQVEEGAIYGEHYAEHFISTIEVLKVIIERLEGLQNGN